MKRFIIAFWICRKNNYTMYWDSDRQMWRGDKYEKVLKLIDDDTEVIDFYKGDNKMFWI